jgi:hypothetical protein
LYRQDDLPIKGVSCFLIRMYQHNTRWFKYAYCKKKRKRISNNGANSTMLSYVVVLLGVFFAVIKTCM